MFVMTLGELNYSDNFLEKELSFSTLANVLFIVLVLGMPIIMMNMLVSGTLNSIRQTDVDTSMIRTQSRVRVRVRVIYLNQTGIGHQILGGVGVTMMHSRSDAPSSYPTHSILNCFFP